MPRPTHYRPAAVVQKLCRACGNEFFPKRRHARYCGDACRQKISRAMRQTAMKEAKRQQGRALTHNTNTNGEQQQ